MAPRKGTAKQTEDGEATPSLAQKMERIAVRTMAICYRYPEHMPVLKELLDYMPTRPLRALAGALVSAYNIESGDIDHATFDVLSNSNKHAGDVVEQSEAPEIERNGGDPRLITQYREILIEGKEKDGLARKLDALSESLRANSEESMEEIRAQAVAAVQGYVGRTGVRSLEALEEEAMEEVAHWESGDMSTVVRTGLESLDDVLRFPRGNISTFGAFSGGGKTIFGGQVAVWNARRILDAALDAMVVYFSAEMTGVEMYHRMAGHISGVTEDLLIHTEDPTDRAKLFSRYRRALKYLPKLPLIIDDTVGPSTDYVHARIAQLQATTDVQLVLFDHTEKVTVNGQPVEEQALLSTAIQQFKNTAKALGPHIMLLHQYSRSITARDDHYPRISDLRGSGRLEHECHGIMLLHSELALAKHAGLPDPPENSDGSYTVSVDVAKHRNGPTGVAHLHFSPDTLRFFDPHSKQSSVFAP